MAHPIESILGDLYLIDPTFKQHEKELRQFIEKLLNSNPSVEMNAAFSADLRRQLVRQAKVIKASRAEIPSESRLALMLKRILYPFTGGILATLLLIVMINPQIILPPPKELINPSKSIDPIIKGIEDQIVEVDSYLTTCVKTEIPLLGESTEGGLVTYYHKPSGLQKMKEELLGETSKTVNKYYYENEKLVYVVHEIHEYNLPIYWDEKKAAESGSAEVFDPEKSAIKQSIYYFDQDHLVRWINEEGKAINIAQDVTQVLQGEFLLNRSDELIWRFEAL